MEKEYSKLPIKCPNCNNSIIISKVWYPGGENDYGSFVLECNKCKTVFEISVGRDVDASSVESGASLVERKYRS